jgi:hypothetical protein
MNTFLTAETRPGTDRMSKAIIQDPTVVNYITKSLINTENDCFIGSFEWSDGTRSDVVLEPKSSNLGLPKMDWITCLAEGKRLGLLKYKNPNALHNRR